MVYLVFGILAGFFMAVMDRTAEPVAFNNSIFSKKNPKWWVRSVSWEYVKFLPFTKYRPDAWHISKSCMIVSFSLMCALHAPFTIWWIDMLIDATVVTGSFVIFYDYILKRKQK